MNEKISKLIHGGELYVPMDEELMEEQFKCLDTLYDFNATKPSEFSKREELLKSMFAEIGDNCVIGAGSVIIKDIPENSVAYGNPCRVARQISERDREYYFKYKKISYNFL